MTDDVAAKTMWQSHSATDRAAAKSRDTARVLCARPTRVYNETKDTTSIFGLSA